MTTAEQVASSLLEIGAIKLSPSKPFRWASGWHSPIYCDNRFSLSYPASRTLIKNALVEAVKEKYAGAEAIAGVATAGIPQGALIADALNLPFIYVRPKPKEHGLGNQIEGTLEKGQKVVVIEDLISTGKSSLQVCDVLKAADVEVIGMVSIFTYGFAAATKAFESAGIPYKSLTNYVTLINLAIEKGIVSPDQQKTLLNWSADPANWSGN